MAGIKPHSGWYNEWYKKTYIRNEIIALDACVTRSLVWSWVLLPVAAHIREGSGSKTKEGKFILKFVSFFKTLKITNE